MREGIINKRVASLQPGDVLHGSGDTIVSVRVNQPGLHDLKADRRKATVITTHPRYGRRVREWNKDTSVGVVAAPSPGLVFPQRPRYRNPNFRSQS